MRALIAVVLAAYLIASGLARAESKVAPIFACEIGGKQISVSKKGARFVYRFGTTARREIEIVGDPAAGTLFRLRQRFAGPETQVRFVQGAFSYIVFAAEGNPQVGARSVSGVTVMKGPKILSSLTCARFTEFTGFDDAFASAPEDSAAYSGL